LVGLNFLAITFSGLHTATRGGILHDVFVNEASIVFVKEPYASASFVGVVTFFFGLLVANLGVSVAARSSTAAAPGQGLHAMRYNWNLLSANAV